MVDVPEIRLLGPFEVRLGGRPAELTGMRRHGVLAALALRPGRVVGVDELVDALWGSDLPAAPRNAIQHHVARLRAALGRESIVASSRGYALRDASVDAVQFEDLLAEARSALREGDARVGADSIERGLALWRGRALQGLPETEWFASEARHLEALRTDALEERFEARLAVGEHRELVSELRATVDEHPFRERLWGQLMLALYRAGRQADALEAFREARRVLAQQLGLEPGPGLRHLQHAILDHDPGIAPVAVRPEGRGGVPAATTSFVDREGELPAVMALLREHRLVTLTGPPGIGKSRLALEVARLLEPDLRDGVWLVELARASRAQGVERVLADAVDARGPDPLGGVVARLRDAEAVILLDACEHALAEVTRVASAVLRDCSDVRILATSREVLHIPGEAPLTLRPLAATAPAAGDAATSPAVQLFAARARAARPGFELTADAVPAAAEIVRRLDGLPLAIELAAARIKVLGLAELRSLVERRLGLLRDRLPDDPIRTALEELVEWSYELLQPDEKALLHQLAVHRGGASLSSLLAVAAKDGLDEGAVTSVLAALVDKSIVSVSFPDEEARYDLLDTVRDYALERLAESGRLAAARRAHAEYVATLADTSWAELRGPDWKTWVRRLDLEHDNLWAALDYVRDARDAEIAGRLASLAWYFTLAGRVTEGRRFVETALSQASDDTPADRRMDTLGVLCFLATEELDYAAAIEIGEHALARGARRSDEPPVGLVQATLGLALAHAGDLERGAALAEQARATLEGRQDHWASAVASLLRAHIAAAVGDVPKVAAMAADAHRHAETIGFDAFSVPAALLDAWVAERRNDVDAATNAYRRALDLASDVGFSDHVAFCLSGLASCAFARGDLRHAEELQRRALRTAEGARASWAAAHARVGLGRVLAAAGDTDTAARLFRNVVEWAERPRPHRPRESLFLALAEEPAAAASAALVDLRDAGPALAVGAGSGIT